MLPPSLEQTPLRIIGCVLTKALLYLMVLICSFIGSY